MPNLEKSREELIKDIKNAANECIQNSQHRINVIKQELNNLDNYSNNDDLWDLYNFIKSPYQDEYTNTKLANEYDKEDDIHDLIDNEIKENEDDIPTLENFSKIKNTLFPKLTGYGSPSPKYTEYTSKDKMRIEDILTKSDRMAKRKLGNFTAVKDNNIDKEEEAKAQQMANAITDYFKAVRRGNAAIALGEPEIAKIFYKKAQVLRPNNMSEAIVNYTSKSNNESELRSLINNIFYKRTSYIKTDFGGNERVIKEEDCVKLIDDLFILLKKIKDSNNLA